MENEAGNHRHDDKQVLAHARDFDVITALPSSYRGRVRAMKKANPDLTVFGYYNGTFAYNGESTKYPESWYARDGRGNKIRNNWGVWMMDPSNPKWAQERAEYCANLIAESGYDGCMMDNMGSGTLAASTLTGQPINPATGNVWTHGEWLRATSRIAATVRARIAPAPLLVNGMVSGNSYFNSAAPARQLLDSADYGLAETWMRTATQPATSLRTEAAWRNDVDLLVDAGARGKRILTLTKMWAPGSTAEKRQWHRFAFASFLLGDDGSHHFAFSYGRGVNAMAGHDLTDVAIGDPVGPYAKVGGVYQRSFTKGRVVVNPTQATVTVPLGAAYTDIDGARVTSVTLAPGSASILTTG